MLTHSFFTVPLHVPSRLVLVLRECPRLRWMHRPLPGSWLAKFYGELQRPPAGSLVCA